MRPGSSKKKKNRITRKTKPDQRYTIDEIANDPELWKKIIKKKREDKDDLPMEEKKEKDIIENDNLTREQILARERPILQGNSKKSLLTREEKHMREVQALVLLDSILEQTSVFTGQEKVADFTRVSLILGFIRNR